MRVLVVGDDAIEKLLLRGLEREGLTAVRAATGAGALADSGYDVVLLDLALSSNRIAIRLDEFVHAQQAFVADASHQLRSGSLLSASPWRTLRRAGKRPRTSREP
ncbi:MAG: response regulator transcription factor [Actinobacteria bacterium]|nr:response regulator transcription factor [Actinomycetota bacterium]